MSDRERLLRWPIPGRLDESWEVRPFGQSLADLEMDFRRWHQPALVSAVLQTCLQVVSGELGGVVDPWPWTINKRLQGLLAVTIATRGARLDVTVTCPVADCGESMDIPLELHAFRVLDDPVEVPCRVDGSLELRLRIPTGTTQLRWLHQRQSPEAALDYAGMARELVVAINEETPQTNWCLPEAWLPVIEAVLEKVDPFTTLELNTQCPHCVNDVSIPLDLETECVNLLAAEQLRVLDEIHCLAVTYHWNEVEIMALPVARRRQYLRRIEEAGFV